MVRWPIYASNLNTRDYSSTQEALSDLELLIMDTLQNKLNISAAHIKVRVSIISQFRQSYKVLKNYSAVLVIPDLYDRSYIREMINLLIYSVGFKQVCAQQVFLDSFLYFSLTLPGIPGSYIWRWDIQCMRG